MDRRVVRGPLGERPPCRFISHAGAIKGSGQGMANRLAEAGYHSLDQPRIYFLATMGRSRWASSFETVGGNDV